MRRSRAASSGDSEVGSNSWVVSGDKTVSGKPLLASDPHLPPTSPSIWHIVHLSAPDLRVAGVAVPGVPGVMIGHNEWIAWGVTNLCPDVQDLYIEQFDVATQISTRLRPAGVRQTYARKRSWCEIRPVAQNLIPLVLKSKSRVMVRSFLKADRSGSHYAGPHSTPT